MGFVKLKFDGRSLGNPGQLRIGGLLRDHFGTVVRAFSKLAGQGLVIGEEILTHFERLLQAKGLGLSNFLGGGDSAMICLLLSYHRQLKKEDLGSLISDFAKLLIFL